MLDTEKTVAKANKWLETAEDPLDIEDVQMYLGRIDKNSDSPRVETWVKAIHQIVKGTRLTITLTEGQNQEILGFANMLNEVFTAFPNMTVPRDRTQENILEKVTEAMIASIKAGSQ
tara:strand:- start:12472 stop:12822 length:351 start_codon:yes stop_codon:yes gene_type:complete